MTRAIVVGGGPAGLAAATRLARGGAETLLLEAGELARPRLCGEFLSPDAFGALQELGVLDAVRALDPPVLTHVLATFSEAGRLRARYGTQLPAAGLGVARTELEPLLVTAARSAGVVVRERARVRGVALEPACGLQLTVGGEVESADVVVLATGRGPCPADMSRTAGTTWIATAVHLEARPETPAAPVAGGGWGERRTVHRAPAGSLPWLPASETRSESTRLAAATSGPHGRVRHPPRLPAGPLAGIGHPGVTELHFVPGAYVGLAEVVSRGRRVVNACALFSQEVWDRAGGCAEGAWDELARTSPPFAEAWRRAAPLAGTERAAAGFTIGVARGGGDPGPCCLRAGDAAGVIAPLAGAGQSAALAGGLSAADRLLGVSNAPTAGLTARLAASRRAQSALLRPVLGPLLIHALRVFPPAAHLLFRRTRGAFATRS